ncbi:MAG: Fe-S-cluster containining protein [Luteibaculaceae bacterium]|jgi:Fe-S-cluster containining protein
MSDPTNICLSCGICCDGTLVGFVKLEAGELNAVRKVMDIEEENGDGFFLQPCKKFCNACTIYEDRPKQCASFECGLLKSVDQKELSFDSAVGTVQEAKQLKLAIEKQFAALDYTLKSPSFYFQMVELKRALLATKKKNAFSEGHVNLERDIDQLGSLLLNKFGLSNF